MNCRGLANVNEGGPLGCRGEESPYSRRGRESLVSLGRATLLPWNHATNQVFTPNLAAGTNTMPKAGPSGTPSGYPWVRVPWREPQDLGWSPSEEEEGWGRKCRAFWDPPHLCNCRLRVTSCGGNGPPPKRTLRKKITWEPGERGREGGGAKLGWRCPWVKVWKLTTVWLSVCCSINTAGPWSPSFESIFFFPLVLWVEGETVFSPRHKLCHMAFISSICFPLFQLLIWPN